MGQKSLRVLIVDDFELVRLMLTRTLRQRGISQIVEAENGQVAIEKLDESLSSGTPFDLVFLDWNMPIKTGLEVIKHARKKSELQNLPIVMVTAESEKKQVLEALSLGADDYVVKPFSEDVIEEKLKKHLKLAA